MTDNVQDFWNNHWGVPEIGAPRFLEPYGPKIEPLGGKKGRQMSPKWGFGGPKVDQKCTKVGPRARSGSTGEQGVPQNGSARLRRDFEVHFGCHFCFKNESTMEPTSDVSRITFWRHFGRFGGHMLGGGSADGRVAVRNKSSGAGRS